MSLSSALAWTGDWSFVSPLWTDELRADCGYTHNDPAHSWLSLEDFQRVFQK